MKLFNKVMSLIIASIMMLQVAAFAAPAPADVNGTFYEDAAKLLSALEVMVGDGNNFNGEKNITRAEFTKIMVAAAGNANIVAGYKPKGVFTDVPISQWYAPYVEFGKDMGAINGMGDGTFAPNNNVTGEQAVKMMVCIIGYGLQAAEIGYPEGYVSVASNLGALKGIANIDLTKPMTRGQAAVLCANIMKVDVLKKVATGDKEQWTSQKGVTLLSSKFDAYELEGVVSANATTAIWQASDLKAGEVEITVDGVRKIFQVGDTDIDTQIGANVNFVYQYDDYEEESTVICYTISERENKSVTVDFEQFEMDAALIATDTDGALLYWPSEDAKRAEKIEIEDWPAIIYNGVATTDASSVKNFLEGKLNLVGNVTFLDANGIKGAETIIVTAYENYVIGEILAEDYIIIDRIQKTRSIEFDLDNENVTATFVDKNGKQLSFESLKFGDVISVAASDGRVSKRNYHVIVCKDKVSGVVQSFGDNEFGKLYAELDNGKTYVFDHITRNIYSNGGLKLGKEVSFNLDAFGMVALREEQSTTVGNFGFFIRYVESQSTTGSFLAKVFTADGKYEILPLAAKVTIDGDKCDTKEKIRDALMAALDATTYAEGARGFAMLYELNASGEIDYIDTTDNPNDEDKDTLGEIKDGTRALVEREYSQYYKGFDNTIPFSSSAVIIAIPADGDFENEKKVYVMKQFVDGNYNLQLLNTNRNISDYTFGICVTADASAEGETFKVADTLSKSIQRPHFVVRKTTKMLVEDEYGDDIVTLKVYGVEEGNENASFIVDPEYYADGSDAPDKMLDHVYNGKTYEATGKTPKGDNFTHENSMSSARRENILLPGDIVLYGKNSKGQINYVRTIFLYEENAFKTHNSYNVTNGITRLLGTTDIYIPLEVENKMLRMFQISNHSDGFNPIILKVDQTTGLIKETYSEEEIATKVLDVGGLGYSTELEAHEVRNIGSAKITVVDLNEKKESLRVRKGTITDIVDAHQTNQTGVPTTPIIVRNYDNNVKAIIVLKTLNK